MTKKETLKWIVQIIASIASAILTALGATSCMGFQTKEGSQSTAFFLYSNEIHWISFYNKRITFRMPETIDFEIDV